MMLNLAFIQVMVKVENQVVNLVVMKAQDQLVDLGGAALTESSRTNEAE